VALCFLLTTYRLILFGAVTKAFIKLLTVLNLTYFGFFVNLSREILRSKERSVFHWDKKMATCCWLPVVRSLW